jgi:MYXO-CTERM domain-containing protein
VSVVYGGSQDNGIMRSNAGSLEWKGISAGDGGPCAVDTGDSKNVLLSISGGVLFRSQNAGASLGAQPVFAADPSFCTTEPGCGDRVAFIPPVVADPVNAHTFYVGTHRVWKNDQGGAQAAWKAISPDLTAGPGGLTCATQSFPHGDDVLSVVMPARDGATIYTGSQGGVVERSTDGGTTWTPISKGVLPPRYVSGIAVDPLDPKRVYVSFSGFSKDTPVTPGHVFRSTDGGDHWTAADTPGDEPIDALVAHPSGPGLLYAGTESGVLVSEDSGTTWQPLDDGLPHSAVYSLLFHEKSATLLAGTHGRSVWSLTFPDADVDAMPTSLTFEATVDGPDPAPQTIKALATLPLGSTVPFIANTNVDWITGFPKAGGAAGAEGTPVVVTVSIAGLAVGGYDGKVVLTGRTHDAIVPVHLEIKPATTPTTPKPSYAEISGGGCLCRVDPAREDAPIGAVAGAVVLAMARRRRSRRR